MKINYILAILFCLFIQSNLIAQTDEDPEVDSNAEGFNSTNLLLGNPKSIVGAYTYDPIIDKYIYNNKFGEVFTTYPKILTPEEYYEIIRKEQVRKYFREKTKAIEGKDGDSLKRKDLLPTFYVKNSLFETIFGGNEIKMTPRGNVELDLGVMYTKQDNPILSPRNRTQTSFDFNQRVQVGFNGTIGTRLNINMQYDTQATFAFQNLIKVSFNPSGQFGDLANQGQQAAGMGRDAASKGREAAKNPIGTAANEANKNSSGEDTILKNIEFGNINLPLNNTLIRGAQNLFGAKAQFQFGKTYLTTVFSEQRSQNRSITAQGGGTMQEFEIFGLDYDADRHFFLSQYFRNQYDRALTEYPYINSRVQLTRVEVWITNRQNNVNPGQHGNNLRNIIALQDLGEAQSNTQTDNEIVFINPVPSGFFTVPANTPSDNRNNLLDPRRIESGNGLLNANIRTIVTSSEGFNFSPANEGSHYSKLENARKLNPNEFTFHPQLGYVSLQQRLANDEVLAVAYQYTIGDQVYQVGEFGNDGVDNNVVDPATAIPETQALILKKLKSTLTFTQQPIWNLMMKNIYQIPSGFNLSQEEFKLNVLHLDPAPLNYLSSQGGVPLPSDVENTPLLNVLNVDNLDFYNDPQNGGDGFFDFIPGLTIDPQNGRVIFTTVEPFGKHLFTKLSAGTEEYTIPASYNANQEKYVFRRMYASSQADALQDSQKNKFVLRGRFKSAGGGGIPIGGFNLPRGSVIVTAGGRRLIEGVDYTVNYQQGRVNILDPSLQNSNTPINISVENNAVFGQQTRRFWGFDIEHRFNEKFKLGFTYLTLSERPFTQKATFGQESVNNNIFGFNGDYSTEVPFLTRLVNKLPFHETTVPSNLSIRGEVAFLRPDTPSLTNLNDESTIYVEDFEGSQSTIDMSSPFAWNLSSTPVGDFSNGSFNFNAAAPNDDLSSGYKRSKLAWYTIDPLFFTNQRPVDMSDADFSLNKTRRVFIEELFPVTDVVQGESRVVNTLDLAYFPRERGPYNFNPNYGGTNNVPDPQTNFGGITRGLTSTNFEQGNVEYIQFWMMDPYTNNEHPTTNTGKLVFNLGEISEDVLKDGRKQYENGLPEAGSVLPTIETNWGRVPATQSLIYAFDTNPENRAVQDIGLDGLNNQQEAAKFPAFATLPDPAADDYQFYLTATGNLTQRYKNYNGLERNTPVEVTDNNRGNSTFPDVEDVNRDNTMNTINAYYEYEINIGSGIGIGSEYVTDVKETSVTTSTGEVIPARWLQFKIPVFEFTRKRGDIEDFRSIRFMRMFMTGFNDEMTLRLGTLELIRADWRRFLGNLADPDVLPQPIGDNTQLDVLAVNILENQSRIPIPYVLPPGVVREQLNTQNTVVNQNEQSLSLRVTRRPGDSGGGVGGLEPQDARGVFKAVDVDMRQFKKMRMFLHAEAVEDNQNPIRLRDDEMSAFIRFGNDFTDNFYQIEIPLKVTPWGESAPDRVWPIENEMELKMELLTKLKILYRQNPPTDPNAVYYLDEIELDPDAVNKPSAKLRLGIKGNPNFGFVRTIMLGVKNNKTGDMLTESIRGEAWFNELRLSEMDNKGGMAAILNVDSNLADFATISATGRMSTIGFGAIEDGANQRSREDIKQYDFVTNVSLGKLFPKKWGLNVPFNYAIGEKVITPEYDPYNQDIRLEQLLDVTTDESQREIIRERAIDYTMRQSINFIGVRKDRGEQQKQRIYDVENFTFSHSYNKEIRHNFEIDDFLDQQTRSAVDYTYAFKNKPIEPFKKSKIKDKRYWKLLSDFNFNYLPSNINFNTNIIRHFNRQRFREVENFGLPLRPLFRRNYLFNYTYGFNFNLTKSLRINYNANTNNIVRYFIDEDNNPDNTNVIWDDYFNPGIADRHNQQLTVNYDLPINKLPFLSFLRANYTYTGNYQWQRASTQMSNFTDENNQNWNLGNSVQNSGSHRINGTITMSEFYKYVGLTGTKKPKTPAKPEPPKILKPGEKIENKAATPAADDESLFLKTAKGLLMSVKSIQGNYVHNTGVSLPGFLEGIGFFGSTKPSVPFTLGLYDDVRYEAARKGWLTVFPEFNMPYTEVETKQMNFTAKLEPIPDLTIDLLADQNRQENFSEQFDVSNGIYNPRSPYNFGNFTSSTIMIKTAFGRSDEVFSEAFESFRSNRIVIANRLAERFYGTPNFPVINDPLSPNAGYPVGFGKNQQEVLASSFMAAYLGADAGSINTSPFRNLPLPNWNVKYTGLMRLKFMKDLFRRFSIEHGYRSSYTINAYRSNLMFNNPQDPTNTDVSGNLIPQTLLGNINMIEQFNPLVRVDFELKNSFNIRAEMKKDRAMSLSFDNALLTEVQGLEYTLGTGYRIKDVIIRSRLADNPEGFFKSDLNIMANFSFRDNKTIVRYLDFDNSQLGGGQNLWSVRFTADYAFTRNLSAIFTYDHTFNKAVISTAFPVTNIRSFITIRYSLGN